MFSQSKYAKVQDVVLLRDRAVDEAERKRMAQRQSVFGPFFDLCNFYRYFLISTSAI
jgi:hypothetical protein